MTVDPTWYAGREQAFVKHSFLDRYLGRLFNKLASSGRALAYIDGFAGPWKSAAERFEDTSFGIALAQLRGARAQAGGSVRTVAHLVERDPTAFAELATVAARFPELEVIPHLGDFHSVLPTILESLPPDVFSFALLDPKGWSAIDLQRLEPLLSRRNSEVVVNLMYDFINRFIEHPNQRIAESLNRTLPGPDWREAIRTAPVHVAAAREAIITETFSDALKRVGGYQYAPSLRVRRPGHERTLYHLFYGTRSTAGLAVFREAQVKALSEEAVVHATIKRQKRELKTRMESLFSDEVEAAFDPAARFLETEAAAAKEAMLRLLDGHPRGVSWREVWPSILEKFAITHSALGRVANELRKSDQLNVSGWPSERKQIPRDDYVLSLRNSDR